MSLSILNKKVQLDTTFYINSSNPVNTVYTDTSTVWINVTLSPASTFVGCCWSPDLHLFVAVADTGSGNRVSTSSDGIVWNSQVTPNAPWNNVTWSPYLGLFAASAATNTNAIMTSPDGITWTSRVTPGTNHIWADVVWSSELKMFVVTDRNASSTISAMYSYDGITWIEGSTPATSLDWWSCVWSPQLGLFVAVSISRNSGNNGIMTSSDGITWTGRTHNSANPALTFGALAWSPDLGMFVALSDGSNFGIRSTDGINWYSFNSIITTGVVAGVWCPGLSKFIFTNTTTNSYFSSDGYTWTSKTTPTTTKWAVCWSNELNKAVAVGPSSIITYTPTVTTPTVYPVSYDDTSVTSWTAIVNANNSQLRDVCWSKELALLVAVGPNAGTGNQVATSTNGTTWTFGTSANDNGWSGVAWSPTLGLFAAVAYSGGASSIMTSPDGFTWTTRISPNSTSNQWSQIIWVPELSLFLVGDLSTTSTNTLRAMRSSDGITWVYSTTPNLNRTLFSMAWSPQLRIAVAVSHQNNNNDGIYTTTDGITWVSRTHSAGATSWLDVAWSPDLGIFSIGNWNSASNYGLTSVDGINWTLNTNVPIGVWHRMCWADSYKRFIQVNTDVGSLFSADGVTWYAKTLAGNKLSVIWVNELNMAIATGYGTYNVEIFQPTIRTQSNIKGTVMKDLTVANIDNRLYLTPDQQSSMYELNTTSVSITGATSSNYIDILKLNSGGSYCHFDLFITAKAGPEIRASYVFKNGFASKSYGQYNTISVIAPTKVVLLEKDSGTDANIDSNLNNLRVTVVGSSSVSTTINSGATLPQSVITVVSTANFNSFGVLFIQSASGVQTVSYTGITGTTFTGCSGGTGLMSVGGVVSPAINLLWTIKARYQLVQNN